MTDNDDAQVGRLLNRREALALFGTMGVAGAAVLAGCSDPADPEPTPGATGVTGALSLTSSTVPSCVVVPELTEGPYFVDLKLKRSDIRGEPNGAGNRPGMPLLIAVNVSLVGSGGCTPLADATVDVWHCDASGLYSSVSDPGFNTRGQQFLRGYQTTDANGKSQFTTIYPGWYQGRAVHIHFKIRSGSHEFTSQWFFDENVTDQVHALQPYAAKGQRTLKNDGDGIYRQGGSQLILNTMKVGEGYAAVFDVGLKA